MILPELSAQRGDGGRQMVAPDLDQFVGQYHDALEGLPRRGRARSSSVAAPRLVHGQATSAVGAPN